MARLGIEGKEPAAAYRRRKTQTVIGIVWTFPFRAVRWRKTPSQSTSLEHFNIVCFNFRIAACVVRSFKLHIMINGCLGLEKRARALSSVWTAYSDRF